MLKRLRIRVGVLIGLLLVGGGLVGVWRVGLLGTEPITVRETELPEGFRVATLVSTFPPSPSPERPPDPGETLRAVETAPRPVRDLFDLAVRFGRVVPQTPRLVPSGPYEKGDRETFWVADIEHSGAFTATAELRLVSAHAYWWVEAGYDVAQSDLQKAAERFEKHIYPTAHTLFGSEWSPGVDGDTRLHIFMGHIPGVGGYFSGADEFPQAVAPFSNQKEIVYINIEEVQPGEAAFDAVLAHELQHLIHWHQDRNEATWVNEGLAELAVELSEIPVDRSSAIRAFLDNPDISLTLWEEPGAAAYGAALSFFQHVVDRLGPETVRRIVAQPADGARGIEVVAASAGLSFEDLFAGWVVAHAVEEEPTAYSGRLARRKGRAATPSARHRVYPVTVEQAEVHQFGADYVVFDPPDGQSGTLEITFRGEPIVALVPTSSHSGRFAFWSNRGDELDSRLTRAFDLTEVSRATLRFWAWYDVEQDYDYVYVLVSQDGGHTWQLLAAEGTTTTNPNGNALGPGYTGFSGCGETDEGCQPRWQLYIADLTPFAGKRVLVRFEYVTDDAINRHGFLLDDVSIPELNYFENFEAGNGGWQAEGWVRVDNVLPQRYLVQAVLLGAEGHQVERMFLDDHRQGKLRVLNFGDWVRQVVLVVSGTTPGTSVPARYGYEAIFVPEP